MLSRHRINCAPPAGLMTPVKADDGTFRIPPENLAKFREFCDTWHVNAFHAPHPRSAVRDPVAETDTLRAWLRAWDEAAKELDRPHVVFYTYLKDEPNDEEAYRYVQKWGRAVRSHASALKVMVVEQTWTQKEEWGDLHGAVDIWCPLFSLFRPESAAKRQALGETVWTYTALCQREPTPWWHIDYPLLHYRVPAWIAWRYGIEDYEYLSILERAGLGAEAREAILPLAGSWFEWETDPEKYEAARAKLAEMIVAAAAQKPGRSRASSEGRTTQ